MKPTQLLANNLHQVYFGGNWTASNFTDTLEGVTLDIASKKVNDLNTILGLTYHIHYYLGNIYYWYYGTQVMQYDPNALTQTGPGMPKWIPFETFNFSWSGPVTRDQMVSFTLIGPKTNLVLAFMRVKDGLSLRCGFNLHFIDHT